MADGSYRPKSAANSVEISLEPEFKGISSLLSDITKYRIINEKDGLAAMKISRALFQAFLKYRLTESKARELNNDEEATLKRVLSYLIEVEEGRIPQLNLVDRSKKASKFVQTEAVEPVQIKSRFADRAAEDPGSRRGIDVAAVNLDAPKEDFFLANRVQSRQRARSRSPSPPLPAKRLASPSRRFHEERSEQWGRSSRSSLSPKRREIYHKAARDAVNPYPDVSSKYTSRELEPPDFGNRNSSPSVDRFKTSKIDDVRSVKIIEGCKLSRITRVRMPEGQGRMRGGAIDYASDYSNADPRSGSDSFSMKIKTAPTLSQARNVAATKLGLYTDLAKSAYRK